MIKKAALALLLAFVMLFVVGCGDGGGGNPVDTGLPANVGKDEFAGTTWEDSGYEEGVFSFSNIYAFNQDGTAKYSYKVEDFASDYYNAYDDYYYYSYDSEKGFLYLKYKSIDYFSDGKQYTSCPSKDDYWEFLVKDYGSEEGANDFLEERGMTLDEGYENLKKSFNNLMNRIITYPYEIVTEGDNTELRLYYYYGDSLIFEDSTVDFSPYHTGGVFDFTSEWNSENESWAYELVIHGEEGDETYTITEINGNTITWSNGSTSDCTLVWNNEIKGYVLYFDFGGKEYDVSFSSWRFFIKK